MLFFNFFTETVYTPNRTDVSLPSGNDPTTYLVLKYLNDLPAEVKNDIIVRNSSNYNLIQTNGAPTTSYNCHSYAWYNQNTSINDTWISFPTAYYIDCSYESINTPRMGDIICYYDSNGTQTEVDDINLHSGIIVGLSGESSNGNCGDSNMYIVKSKWGMEGLYTHKGDECPYTSSYGGTADYVKYYRPRTNDTYTLTSSFNSTILSNINGNGSITDKYSMYELNTNGGYYEFSVSSDKQLDVRLYDIHMQLVNINQITTGTYTNSFIKYLSQGTYYLRVAYQNTSQSGNVITNISNHSHSYGAPCVWINYTQHTATCACGGLHIEYHVVIDGPLPPGQQYATCIVCGGPASMGIVPPNKKSLLRSQNGSYILLNGIVVLVDDDIKAYLDGTLIFNYYNVNLPNSSILPYIFKREEDVLYR